MVRCYTSIYNQQTKMREYLLLLLLLLVATLIIGSGGSYCIASGDCKSGLKERSSLSQYLRACCVLDNLGKKVTIRERSKTKYILCPVLQPKSCPSTHRGELKKCIIEFISFLDVMRECLCWYEAGNTTDGVYTISPDGFNSFQV